MDRIDLLTAAYDHVSRTGQWPREIYARDAEFDASATALPVTRGREAADLWRDYVECFEDFRIDPLEFLDAGSDRIVVTVRDGGRMKGSDRDVHNEYTHVWTFAADDKITRWATFPTKTEALAHVGLEETT